MPELMPDAQGRYILNVVWTPRLEPDGQISLAEKLEGDLRTTVFGPFPADLLDQFVAERKAYFDAFVKLMSPTRTTPGEQEGDGG